MTICSNAVKLALSIKSQVTRLSMRSQNPEKCLPVSLKSNNTMFSQLFMSFLCLFILFLVRFWLLNGHLLGKLSCSLGHMFSLDFDYLFFSLLPARDVISVFLAFAILFQD